MVFGEKRRAGMVQRRGEMAGRPPAARADKQVHAEAPPIQEGPGWVLLELWIMVSFQ
jgi:hypothetical protein